MEFPDYILKSTCVYICKNNYQKTGHEFEGEQIGEYGKGWREDMDDSNIIIKL